MLRLLFASEWQSPISNAAFLASKQLLATECNFLIFLRSFVAASEALAVATDRSVQQVSAAAASLRASRWSHPRYLTGSPSKHYVVSVLLNTANTTTDTLQ